MRLSVLCCAFASAAALHAPHRAATPRMIDPAATTAAAGLTAALVVARRPRGAPPPVGSPRLSTPPPLPSPSPVAKTHELRLTELLREYGVIALLFHFSVWCLTLAVAFSALSLGGAEALSSLPLIPPAVLLPDQPAGGLGRAAIVLALVEVSGPARLALTLAVTPALSKKARDFAAVRRVEAALLGAVARGTEVVRKLLPLPKEKS
ncbi:hypothetical protein AB1Y20_018440 [Prymnesium parvum]|uniref:Uncharacterized protein n=1 Tax=Prymnesium parvum TaxID=97485 RepID=A0AB34JS02_PRYPA